MNGVAEASIGPGSGRVALEALAASGLAFLLFILPVSGRPLTEPREGRLARGAQEMLDRGDWLVPYLNGAPRIEKPPLGYWAIALCAELFNGGHVTTFLALLPTAGSSALLVGLVFFWLAEACPGDGEAQRRARRYAGGFGALFLASLPVFWKEARVCCLDAHLALFCALAAWSWLRWAERGARWALPLFYAALALGVLTKAHVAPLVVLPPVLLDAVLRRREADREARRGAALWHAAGAGAALVLILVPGLAFIQRSGMTWADIMEEGGLDRIKLDGHVHHYGSVVFYLKLLGEKCVPWLLLAPAAFCAAGRPEAPLDRARRRFWFAWFGINFAVWSLIPAKQAHYALPWIPPLALILGESCARVFAGEAPAPRWLRRYAAGISGLACLLALILPWALRFKYELSSAAWSLAGAAAACFGLGAAALLRARIRTLLAAWCGGGAALLFAVVFTIEAQELLEDSPLPFADEVQAAVPDSETLYACQAAGTLDPHVLFYLEENVKTIDDENLPELLEETQAYVLVHGRVLRKIPEAAYVKLLTSSPDYADHRGLQYLIRGTGSGKIQAR
ncbi:MAG: glycosyltransferase family 39 protein [Planctomycetota bacterium]|nr:glycosyltransferase family 39 protein [Planctomycetota bacterium]